MAIGGGGIKLRFDMFPHTALHSEPPPPLTWLREINHWPPLALVGPCWSWSAPSGYGQPGWPPCALVGPPLDLVAPVGVVGLHWPWLALQLQPF